MYSLQKKTIYWRTYSDRCEYAKVNTYRWKFNRTFSGRHPTFKFVCRNQEKHAFVDHNEHFKQPWRKPHIELTRSHRRVLFAYIKILRWIQMSAVFLERRRTWARRRSKSEIYQGKIGTEKSQVCLSSSQDSQLTWETNGVSMSQILVNFLRMPRSFSLPKPPWLTSPAGQNPNPVLHNLMMHIW